MTDLTNAFRDDVLSGKAAMADYMKILLYQTAPALIEQLDFDNDDAFLNPLLFTCLSTGGHEEVMTLRQIVYQDLFSEIKKQGIQVISDENGMVFVPRTGYFFTKKPNQSMILKRQNDVDVLVDEQFRFFPSLFLADDRIELYRHPVALLNDYYSQYDDKGIAHKTTVDVSQTVRLHQTHIEKALVILKTYLPELYQEIRLTNQSLSVFYNPQVLCSVNISVHGCTFISAVPTNDEIFFLEELIHQCSHNTFNMMLFERERFFTLDPEQTQLGALIDREHEHRTVLSAIHGLYTVAKRYEAFRLLKELNVFEGLQKHEFLGRLADLEKRYHTGLELMNLRDVFTPKGIEVYTLMDRICGLEIKRVNELKGVFDLSNQPNEFSYAHFQQLNSINHFLSAEQLTA